MSADRVWSIDVNARTRNANTRSNELWVQGDDADEVRKRLHESADRLVDDLVKDGLL